MDNSKAIIHLQKDKRLCALLAKYQVSSPQVSHTLFRDLLDAIISQQLSNKAASTIFKRFLDLFPKEQVPSPEEIIKLSEDTLRSCGVSRQKASYLKSLAQALVSNELILESLRVLPDEEVINSLTKVKGIGRWTAEMFLIFSLGRQDTFSAGDLGLCTAVAKLYGVDRKDKTSILKISNAWSPYRSLASLYLWQSLENQ